MCDVEERRWSASRSPRRCFIIEGGVCAAEMMPTEQAELHDQTFRPSIYSLGASYSEEDIFIPNP